MIIAVALFYIFSFIAVLSAMMVIASKNPVYSVLFLILAFFNAAGLFVLLGAELLAMILIIVYVGAVAVLFLFVVMMLNIKLSKMKDSATKYLPIGILVALVLFAELFFMLSSTTKTLNISPKVAKSTVTNTEALGAVIYTDYIYLFQISGVILLVAMIGAIVLTHRKREGVKKQDAYTQITRSKKDTLEIIKVESGKGV